MSRATEAVSLDPPGFSRTKYEYPAITESFLHGATVPSGRDPEAIKRDVQAKAMSIAKGQLPELFQTALMMYFFIGNQLNLWSIFFLLNMGTAPILFAPFQMPDVNLFAAKALYIAVNLAGTGVFLWKLRGMGVLPITSSDWVSLLPTRTPVEYSGLGSPIF